MAQPQRKLSYHRVRRLVEHHQGRENQDLQEHHKNKEEYHRMKDKESNNNQHSPLQVLGKGVGKVNLLLLGQFFEDERATYLRLASVEDDEVKLRRYQGIAQFCDWQLISIKALMDA
tara:strand:+ start:346 stop:696 length:351 start_codon:yes stop_codon:yes gene_type:complete